MARRSRNRNRSVPRSYRQPRGLSDAELSHIRSSNTYSRSPLPVARVSPRRALRTTAYPVPQRQLSVSFRPVPRRALFGAVAVPDGPSLSRRQRQQRETLSAHVRGKHHRTVCKMLDKGRKSGSGGSSGVRSRRSQRERRDLFQRLASNC